jgi:tetratricopeptide (TPR) repeat protein
MQRKGSAMHAYKTKYIVGALLLLATVAVYWPAVSYEFINYDDPAYVTGNAHVRTGFTPENIRWTFTTTLMGNWNPLTWFSHMADAELYGLNPAGHHLTSILLHGINAVLLFFFLNRTTGALWRSALAAALFALHPLRVESVAWVSERKDVLCALFFMAALLAYASYVRKPGLARYIAIVLLFVLGLMAKPMLVTFPFILLLIDYWPLQRLGLGGRIVPPSSRERPDGIVEKSLSPFSLLVEKIPFFLLSAIFSVIAVHAQKHENALLSLPAHPVMGRVYNALLAYTSYLEKTFWPRDLAVLYPLPDRVPVPHAVTAFLFLACVSLLCVWFSRRYPVLLTGWFWFAGTLVPVIGLIQVGLQSMADRYTYIPSIGLSILFVWSIGEAVRKFRYRTIIAGVASGILILSLVLVTRRQLTYWENSFTLFTHTLAVTENNYVAHTNLGDALDKQGKYGEAMRHYGEALRLKPDDAFVYDKMATDLDIVGRSDEAVAYYGKSLQLEPGNARVRNNLGITLIRRGEADEAIKQFMQAVALDPGLVDAHYNLGLALAEKGKNEEAIQHYSEALRLNPSDNEIRESLEKALAGVPGEAHR